MTPPVAVGDQSNSGAELCFRWRNGPHIQDNLIFTGSSFQLTVRTAGSCPNKQPCLHRATATHSGRPGSLAWIARHVDDGLVAAGVVEAIGNQTAHTLAAHI